MLADTELAQDYTILNEQHKELIASLLNVVGMPGIPQEVAPNSEGNFRGYDGNQFYLVQRGTIHVSYQGKTVLALEEGDMLLPDVAGSADQESSVYYRSELGATLHAYPALEFMRRVFGDPSAIRLWSRLLVTNSGLMLRITASHVPEEAPSTPGFEDYAPGDIIIRQGDRADYVFNMSSGTAEVLVDDVTVGRIGEGEIFGAMAALTHADRSATVKARTACSVVKVPKEQFTELIKSNPATIHSLLIDMANSIVNLNEQLVGLRGNHGVS